MYMLGTIVNAAAIIAGGLAGLLLKGGISERFNEIIMKGLALCILYIGISGSIKAENLLLVVVSIVIGAVMGEAVDIDRRIQNLGNRLESRFKGRWGRVSEGFVTASLLYCVGSMAIVGSLESGLNGNHEILFTKSMLDGVSSVIFASSLGVGVVLSGLSVFIYQGLITVGAFLLKGVLVTTVVNDMSAIGGMLIIGMGLNMLGSAKIKVTNLLPAIFVPVVYQLLQGLHIWW
jgi:uncharacterized membrane protein YqgA involved in biofilm formation